MEVDQQLRNSGIAKQFDPEIEQRPAVDLDQALGHGIGQGTKAGAQPGGE